MLSTLVCTMFLTLCVDVGWKPTEDGKDNIYVIQINPAQGSQMIKDRGFITCGIPEGTKEVRVQFRDDFLAKNPITPILTTLPKEETDRIEEADKKNIRIDTHPDEGNESYLTAAIVSWIVSAGLFAMVVYLGWIHLDIRRRYQTLLNRALANRTDDLSRCDLTKLLPPGLTDSSEKGGKIAPLSATLGLLDAGTSGSGISGSAISGSGISENASTLETLPQKSTLAEPEADVPKDIGPDFDETASLLENTNRAIAQIPGEAELEAVDPRKKNEETETVYGLPEASDDEPSEELSEEDDDDADNWGGVE